MDGENEKEGLARAIAAKRGEWIDARTAELGGRGNAENTRRLAAELKSLESRKNDLTAGEKSIDRRPMTGERSPRDFERERGGDRNNMARKMSMGMSR